MIQRLAQHDGLGLDPADAPAEHAQRIHHGGVRVGADQRVGEATTPSPHLHDRRQVLEVDLVHDAHARRDHLEVPERLLGPAQQRVALAVSLVLTLDVALIRHPRAERVDLHRVVDHQVDRHQRIDPAGIASAAGDRRPHARPDRPQRARR